MFELGNNELIYAAEDSFRSSPVVPNGVQPSIVA